MRRQMQLQWVWCSRAGELRQRLWVWCSRTGVSADDGGSGSIDKEIVSGYGVFELVGLPMLVAVDRSTKVMSVGLV